MKEEILVLMIGLPLSGKSTYVADLISRHPYQVIEGGSIVKALLTEGLEITNENMGPVYETQRIMAKAFMNRQYPIIVDDRNLLIESIFLWRQLAEANGYRTVGKIMDTPAEVCLERAEDAERMHNHIQLCAEQLDELKAMLGLKHQKILNNYEVISGGK